jgi:hypothetical protein
VKVRVHEYEEICTYGYDADAEGDGAIDVPRHLLRDYDRALQAFEIAAQKLWDHASPIYEERRKEAIEKALKRRPPRIPSTWKPAVFKDQAEVERRLLACLNS